MNINPFLQKKNTGKLQRLKETPALSKAAGFSLLLALIGLLGVFFPLLEIHLFNQRKLTVSLLQLLVSGQMNVTVKEQLFSASWSLLPLLFLVVCPLLLTLWMTLSSFILRKVPRVVFWLISFLLFFLQGLIMILLPGLLLSPEFFSISGLNLSDLYFTYNTLGICILIFAFLGMIFSLWMVSGLQLKIKMLSYPYMLWLLLFTLLPLVLILFAAFVSPGEDGSLSFTTAGFQALLTNQMVETQFYGMTLYLQEYFAVFLRSLDYALWTAIGCLVLAYPLAYILSARAKRMHIQSSILLLFFVLPMWINTMLRTYAWRAFLGQSGVLNNILLQLNWISDPIPFLKVDWLADVVIKLVLINDFLPFMLLPIYAVLLKVDDNVRQAAMDLGANTRQTFTKVVFPLSLPGVISGIQMVFMPALTFFMIPEIMSEGSITTIGATVQTFILSENAIHRQAGNVLSLLLLIFVLITMGVLRNSDRETSGGGMVL